MWITEGNIIKPSNKLQMRFKIIMQIHQYVDLVYIDVYKLQFHLKLEKPKV